MLQSDLLIRPNSKRANSKESSNCLIDVQSVVVNGSTPPSPHSPPASTSDSYSVCVLVAICSSTCVSAASGLVLSDQLSTEDSTRSSDDDPRPGLPRGHSAVQIHFQPSVVLRSPAIRVAPLSGETLICTHKHIRTCS